MVDQGITVFRYFIISENFKHNCKGLKSVRDNSSTNRKFENG